MHIRCITVVAGLAAAGILAPSASIAQSTPSAQEIIERLKARPDGVTAPARRTRGLSVAPGSVSAPPPGGGTTPAAATGPAPTPPPAAEKEAVDRVFTQPPGAISSNARKKIADIASTKPAIDLTIYFAFNSAEVGPQAVPGLVQLGTALASPELAGTRFLVAGHTDAKGSADYNQKLSERRAQAIKKFLVAQFKVDERRLLALGFGEEQLKNKADPNADENRRVQVVNIDGN